MLLVACQTSCEHFSLRVQEELVDEEAYLVISVQVLRVSIAQIDATLRVLGELVNDQTHLETPIACEGLFSGDLGKVKRPRVESDHVVSQLRHLHILVLGIFRVERERFLRNVARKLELAVCQE